MPESTLPHSPPMWKSATALAVVAAAGAGILAGIHELTRDDIEAQQQRAVLTQLEQVLGPITHDNVLHQDLIRVSDTVLFPGDQLVEIFRARQDGQPVAAVIRLLAKDGYNGDISLLLGVHYDGEISGVRVLAHKETPGLGDDIEFARSDWILGFDGLSLTARPRQQWAVKRDGGGFDQFTGATMTPRAVVKAVRLALEYFESNKDLIFAPSVPSEAPNAAPEGH